MASFCTPKFEYGLFLLGQCCASERLAIGIGNLCEESSKVDSFTEILEPRTAAAWMAWVGSEFWGNRIAII